jgi:4-diphosphocytidyl-2-C-methyl-D-erythritol kinase
MKVAAPAKINLFLSVGPRAGSGLHEIESVMQTISLADEMSLETAETLTLDIEPAESVDADENNTVVRAARAFVSATGVSEGASMRLLKRIPVAAGLGGGSADAAATLVGLNELWGTRISKKALARIAAGVGSDVAFCVYGGTAGVHGTGEAVAPIPVRGTLWWVIGMPAASVSTRDVYERFDEMNPGPDLADPWEIADALARGDVETIGAALRNDLEPASSALVPIDGRAPLLEASALGAVLSGSGPAWCGLARDEDHAREIAGPVAESFARVEVAHSLTHGPRIIER